MSGEKEEDGDRLIITPKAVLECCRIYAQHVYKGKGVRAAAAEALSVGLGTQVVDAQSSGVHLEDGDESDEEGETLDRPHFATTSPA